MKCQCGLFWNVFRTATGKQDRARNEDDSRVCDSIALALRFCHSCPASRVLFLYADVPFLVRLNRSERHWLTLSQKFGCMYVPKHSNIVCWRLHLLLAQFWHFYLLIDMSAYKVLWQFLNFHWNSRFSIRLCRRRLVYHFSLLCTDEDCLVATSVQNTCHDFLASLVSAWSVSNL